MDEKKIRASVEKARKNEYWKEYYDKAPSEACKRYIALEFYYSDNLGDVPNYDEFESESNKAEEQFTKADWQHLYSHCANNPKKVYYKKKMESSK